jgi:hypothetical protein
MKDLGSRIQDLGLLFSRHISLLAQPGTNFETNSFNPLDPES